MKGDDKDVVQTQALLRTMIQSLEDQRTLCERALAMLPYLPPDAQRFVINWIWDGK